MGIVNVTPDSFSDGGKFSSTNLAVEHALKLAEEGADILDIGGESTRPNATPVSLQEELDRVIPVIEALVKQINIPLSIDTYKPAVMQAAIAAGASYGQRCTCACKKMAHLKLLQIVTSASA